MAENCFPDITEERAINYYAIKIYNFFKKTFFTKILLDANHFFTSDNKSTVEQNFDKHDNANHTNNDNLINHSIDDAFNN